MNNMHATNITQFNWMLPHCKTSISCR